MGRYPIVYFLVIKTYAMFYLVFEVIHRLMSEIAFRAKITDYHTAPVIVKKFKYKQVVVKAQIESYWDYWRMKAYEKYPVEKMEEYIKAHADKNSKIVYYEIGANVGYSFLAIAKMLENRSGEAFAFEIEPTNFKTLSNNVLINQLTNATALRMGIGEKSEIHKFYFNRYHDKASFTPSSGMGMHSLTFNPEVHKKQFFYKALLMPLDNVIRSFSMPWPTHLFIDAYGAEDNIVAGMQGVLGGDSLKTIMVDIENGLEKSRAHKIISSSGFELIDCVTEKGSGVVPTSYKCTYEKK
jgi:FkbM family methyltransferase